MPHRVPHSPREIEMYCRIIAPEILNQENQIALSEQEAVLALTVFEWRFAKGRVVDEEIRARDKLQSGHEQSSYDFCFTTIELAFLYACLRDAPKSKKAATVKAAATYEAFMQKLIDVLQMRGASRN